MDPELTTLAVGEEEVTTTLATGEEEPVTGPSTKMYGEEGELVPDAGAENPFGGF